MPSPGCGWGREAGRGAVPTWRERWGWESEGEGVSSHFPTSIRGLRCFLEFLATFVHFDRPSFADAVARVSWSLNKASCVLCKYEENNGSFPI